MTGNLHKNSPTPPYMAYPGFFLTMDISETAKLLYVLQLDRARLSMKNEGWEDERGHVFIHYIVGALAEATSKCEMTIKDSLNKLELHGLIYRQRQGAGKPDKIYVRVQTETCPLDRAIQCRSPQGGKRAGKETGNAHQNSFYRYHF